MGEIKEEGFGDVVFDGSDKDFNLSNFSFVDMSITPLFMSVQEELRATLPPKGKCFCSRMGECGPFVLPFGDLKSKIVVVGREPGEVEVENGVPFCSTAPGGGLLDDYLAKLNITRSKVYITNVLFCRGKNNVPPTPEQFFQCLRFKYNEFLSLTEVKYIFPLGTHAFQLLTGIFSSISPYVGSYFKTTIFGRDVFIVPLHHPGYLLRKSSGIPKLFSLLESMVL